MKQVIAEITRNYEVMPYVYIMWLKSGYIASEARPGQFVMVRCEDGTLIRRPLSIHQVDDAKTNFALMYKVVGKGTHWLAHQCQEGKLIDILGPLGNGYNVSASSTNLLLVAGGIGIAPLYFLAKEALSRGNSVRLLLGARTASELYSAGQYYTSSKLHTAVQGYPDASLPSKLIISSATEDGTTGLRGLVTNLLPQYIDCADQVFACGPLPMYRYMYARRKTLLKDKPVQVSLEVRMACGMGVCYGCTIKTRNGLKQVCKDGPVFELDDVEWDSTLI